MSPTAKRPSPTRCPQCGMSLYFDWVETAFVDAQSHRPVKVLALICPKLGGADIKVFMTLPGSHERSYHFFKLRSELEAEGYRIPKAIANQDRIQ